MKLDINTDLGEGFGRWKMGDDEALMKIVSSANVACGFHAGDPIIMHRMCELALENGVALGAHVGLPDLLGFGRVHLRLPPEDMRKHTAYQLSALAGIARLQGTKVVHAGMHGALGEMSREEPRYIEGMLEVFKAFDPEICVAVTAGSHGHRYARKIGLRTVGKIFADRAYDDEAKLVSRKQPGAVITDPAAVRERILQFMGDGTVTAMSGKRVAVDAGCVLVHSDTEGAVKIAEMVRETVERNGGAVVPLTELARCAHDG